MSLGGKQSSSLPKRQCSPEQARMSVSPAHRFPPPRAVSSRNPPSGSLPSTTTEGHAVHTPSAALVVFALRGGCVKAQPGAVCRLRRPRLPPPPSPPVRRLARRARRGGRQPQVNCPPPLPPTRGGGSTRAFARERAARLGRSTGTRSAVGRAAGRLPPPLFPLDSSALSPVSLCSFV